MTFVLKVDPRRAGEWQRLFAERAPHIPLRIWPDVGDPRQVRFLGAWTLPDDFEDAYPNLELLFSTGAGVDQFPLASLPPELGVVRLIEPGIINGMIEYVTMMVLALHRDLFDYQRHQHDGRWQTIRVVPASTRRVGVLGLGVLGEAVGRKLADFGFSVSGWSRSRKSVAGMHCFAGDDELGGFLRSIEILVCLLPLTDETRGFLGADRLSALPHGASLINVARGPHLDLEALRALLDTGRLSRAILDVTDPEPLPADHWLWRHDRVLVTPHVASMTQPGTAAEVVLENLRRYEAGEPLLGQVDRSRGY